MRIRMRIVCRRIVLMCMGLFSVAISVSGTTLARLSLDQLTVAANAVARVRCVGAQSRWENGGIWTASSFEVVETMKGALPARIVVRLPGGRIGHLIATVDGTPRFTSGDEAVVFLERSSAGGFSVSGWVQGTFRIGRNRQSGQETVTQDSSSFGVFDAATRMFRAEGVRGMPIGQFRDRLAAAVARAQEKTR